MAKKFFWVSHNIAREKPNKLFDVSLHRLPLPAPKYLPTMKSIFLLLSSHRSPGAVPNSKSCCRYLQNMCQIHQTGKKKFFFLIISLLKSFSVPHMLLPGLLQWLLTGLLFFSYWPSYTLLFQKDHP